MSASHGSRGGDVRWRSGPKATPLRGPRESWKTSGADMLRRELGAEDWQSTLCCCAVGRVKRVVIDVNKSKSKSRAMSGEQTTAAGTAPPAAVMTTVHAVQGSR